MSARIELPINLVALFIRRGLHRLFALKKRREVLRVLIFYFRLKKLDTYLSTSKNSVLLIVGVVRLRKYLPDGYWLTSICNSLCPMV
jgi:hypothetical protein